MNQYAIRPFRTCGSCHFEWPTWRDFLQDVRVRLLGLQAAEQSPDSSLFVFEHRCGTTVSVLAKRLRFLLDDPEEGGDLPSLLGSEECRQHCQSLEDWEVCDRPCVNARDRRLLQLILQAKRGEGP